MLLDRYHGDLVKALLSTQRVFIAVIFVGLLGMAARNVVDPDVWWHLKTGEYIAAHRHVPHTDPFSYTRAGAPWVAHEWLTDLILYAVYRAVSWGGLIVVFAAILSAAFFLLFQRCAGTRYIAGILTLLGAWATAPVWGVRPQVLSLFLTGLWLWILERSERHQKLLWWTPPIMFLWVNLHAGFALGIALLILCLVGEILERVLGQQAVEPSNFRIRTLAAALALNLLVVPLNPYGARMYSYPLETLRSKAINYIVEWASPNFHRFDYFPFLILLLVTVALLAWSNTRPGGRGMLLLLASAFAALSAIRMIPLFVLIAVPIISKSLQQNATNRPCVPPGTRHFSIPFLNAGILLFMAAFVGVHLNHVIRHQPQSEAEHFPGASIAFLETHPAPGPIFDHYDWGGYLIWRLYPQTKVFIDGRADLYGELLLQQFAETYQLKQDWKGTLAEWGIATIIVPPDSALATGLRSATGWTISYEDSRAVIFSKLQPWTRRLDSAKPINLPASNRKLGGDFSNRNLKNTHRSMQENTPEEHVTGYYGVIQMGQSPHS